MPSINAFSKQDINRKVYLITDTLDVNSHLVVFAEVCPHAGAVSTPHQHMVSKEIDPRYRAGKLSCGRVIMISQISDDVVKLEQLVALMLLL